jgi:diguanylate cyclase (GGDEF)-like protein/PAS domain S-box-containing protein
VLTGVAAPELQDALRRVEERLLLLAEQAGGVLLTDGDGRLLEANDRARTLVGFRDLSALQLADLVLEDDLPPGGLRLEALIHGSSRRRELRLRTGDGGVLRVEVDVRPLSGGRFQVLLDDVTARRSAEEALRDSEERYRQLVEASPDAMLVHIGGRIVFANAACAGLLGARDAQELLGLQFRDLVHTERRHATPRRSRSTAPVDQAASVADEVLQRLDGGRVDVELLEVPFTYRGEPAVQVVARDATERKRRQDEITAIAYRDALTGLPNRRLFHDRLAIALAQAHRYRQRLALIFLDLDRFKPINDSLGHDVGDQLLRAVAERLQACVREGDTLARLAGDEFVLLLPGIHYAEDVGRIARKVLEAMRQPFRIGERDLRLTASAGIGVYPDDGDSAEALLKNADTAMYRAKERGRDAYELYAPAMVARSMDRPDLEASLRAALGRGELALHFQPTIDLASGAIVGAEALLRWQHPEYGLVLPRDFISLADLTGLILSIGPWTLRTACEQARRWEEHGFPGLRVSVNFSSQELQQRDPREAVRVALAETGLEPQRLRLEIPEGYAMRDLERSIETLEGLKSLGVGISIDGFGAGYSSLSHLRRLPVDSLKMDLAFVRGTTADSNDASLVTAVIAVAHSLHLRVIAQGVETEAQVGLLRSLRCDEVQGFLWSPPVPAAELETLLARGTAGARGAARPSSSEPPAGGSGAEGHGV